MERRPKSANWWYAQVAEPQSLGVMLVKMRQGKRHLPKQLEQDVLKHMLEYGGDPAKWTGANCTDLCLHWIYRAALEVFIDKSYFSTICATSFQSGFNGI